MSVKIPWQVFKSKRMQRFYAVETLALPALEEAGEQDKTLLKRLYLARALLGRDPLPSVPRIFQDALSWREIPVLVRGQTKAKVFTVLLGLLPYPSVLLEPDDSWLDDEAGEALQNALLFALGNEKKGFLVLSREGEERLTGSSLGLPLAVAAQGLLHEKAFPHDVMMTGKVTRDGLVEAVGFVQDKMDCAFANDATIFLYPKKSPLSYTGRAFPVENVSQAVHLCELAQRNASALIAQIDGWRHAAELFFAWLNTISSVRDILGVLLRMAGEEKWHFTDNEARSKAVKDLSDFRDRNRIDRKDLLALLDFFPYETAQTMDEKTRLRLAGMHVTLENHKGILQSRWLALGRAAWESLYAKPSDFETRELLLTSRIRLFINPDDNAYLFHLPPPARWKEKVEYYLKDNTTGSSLGKSLGCLAQHAAFAGNLHEALRYAEQSLQCFFADRDRQRRWIDETYIYCDLNETEKATDALATALASELSLPSPLPLNAHHLCKTENSFLHAAFVRLCRKKADLFEGYPVASILQKRAKKDHMHPWQCWANNCGCLLAKSSPDLSRECFRESYAICLAEDDGITLLPMALLPLAHLLFFDLASPDELCRKAEKILRKLCTTCDEGLLSKEHFSRVLQAESVRDALLNVYEEQETLFPFNYR